MVFEKNVLVEYYDCDVSIKAKLSSLVRMMMNTVTDHAETVGLSYENLYREEIVFLLAKNIININRMPVSGEVIKISTVLKEIKGVRFIRDIIIDDSNGNRCLSCLTIWMIVNPNTRKILRPAALENFDIPIGMSIIEDSLCDSKFPKIDKDDKPIITKQISAEYSYIDSNNHVNNSYYFDFICNAIPYEEMIEKGIEHIELAYISELLPQQNAMLNVFKNNDGQYHIVANKEDGCVCFEAMVKIAN